MMMAWIRMAVTLNVIRGRVYSESGVDGLNVVRGKDTKGCRFFIIFNFMCLLSWIIVASF